METFGKELALLEKYKSVLSKNFSKTEIGSAFQELLEHHEELLNQASVITKVSDRFQKRLDQINEKLKQQNDELLQLNLKLKERENWLEIEKEKSDKLLMGILNEKVVTDLKQGIKGKTRIYNNVTVFFSDLVDFTTIAESTEPDILVAELNRLFTKFDIIMKKYRCERVDTIGDAYLAVCGMPEPVEKHADNMMQAALEILNFIKSRKERKSNCGRIDWEIRIGIHSGKVADAIFGTDKFSYSVIGDTVNTASRMETNSEPMKINVSETTYNLVKEKFQFVKREPVPVKGKGLMNMYFLKTI